MMNELNPLVSVIVPAYNVERYISFCLDSLKAQTYAKIEVVIVDDGSIDATKDECAPFLVDRRFKYHRIANLGVSHARNYGVANSTGSYVMFVDADDVVCANCIEVLLQNAREANADISVGQLLRITDYADFPHEAGSEKNLVSVDGSTAFRLMMYGLGIDATPCCVLAKRESWGEEHFRAGQEYEDLASMPLFYRRANCVCITQEYLYGYLQRAGSAMHQSVIPRKRILDYWTVIWTMEEESLSDDYTDAEHSALSARIVLEVARFLVRLERASLDAKEKQELRRRARHLYREKINCVITDNACPIGLKLRSLIMSAFPCLVAKFYAK